MCTMFTIAPKPRSTMCFPTRLVTFHVPFRLRSITERQPLSLISSGRAGNCPPALLIRKSILPSCAMASDTNDSTWAMSRMFVGFARQRRPSASISTAVGARFSGFRLAIATSAPRLANASAMPRPIPRPPPVTSTTRSRKRSGANVPSGDALMFPPIGVRSETLLRAGERGNGRVTLTLARSPECSMKSLVASLLLSIAAVGARAAEETPDAAAFRVMDEFLAAFNAKDAPKWADTLQYPHVRFASGKVAVYTDKASFVAAMDLEQFAARTGWAYSTWDERKVVQTSPDKVHVTTLFSRHRADGSVFESFQSLYVV